MTDDKNFKILIVDDEEDNLALLYRSLRTRFDVQKSLKKGEVVLYEN